ncbi:MAG: carbohydrate-binding domain-containing protein [Ruminococcus sp.]|nr:carbohydrate-binding domain-containing protein [Ruminococcus sp.]
MKYRRILAAISAFSLLITVCSCGKDDEMKSDAENTSVSEEVTESENGSKGSEKETKNAVEKKTTTKVADTSDKTTKTTKAGEKKADVTTTAKKSVTSSTTNAPSGENNSDSNNNNSNNGTDNNNGGGEVNADNNNDAPEVKEYTAEIELGSTPNVTGTQVSVSGSVVTITGGGDFRFHGTVGDGQICVNTATEEKVTVILDNVNISNSNGPAIFINEAKRCTIKSREGTVNYLSDGGKDKQNNAVIFSNDTVRLKGNGELNITANNAHGISSDDDIIIDNGTYNINSVKSGLIAHDDITINDGRLIINGGTNGIKSKGTLNINGGYSVVSGGTKEEKSSIYSEQSFNYTGGFVYAAGNLVTVPWYSENPGVVAAFGNSFDGGSDVKLYLNGSEMVSFQPRNSFRCVMMLAPEISSGSSFRVSVNGKGSDDVTIEDGCKQYSVKLSE